MHSIHLRGARTHNLQGVSLDVEPGTLLVLTGPSGAGKSSLAYSTLYAEGQRRYVESFSAYARQFLERLARPPVETLDPVPAAVSVDRRSTVKTSRSTVATMTELSDHLRQLWLHRASLRCPGCERPVDRDSPASAVETLLDGAEGQRVVISYPLAVADPEQYLALRESLVAHGYRRILYGGKTVDLDSVRPSDVLTTEGHAGELDVVVDRCVARASERARLVEAIEAAFARGEGRARVGFTDGRPTQAFSRALACTHCDRSFPQPTQGVFSFNSPVGACEACRGFGRTMEVDWDKVMPDLNLSLRGGAVKAWNGKASSKERRSMLAFCEREGIAVDAPLRTLSKAQREALLAGEGRGRGAYVGLRRWFAWLETKNYKMHVRVFLSRYRKYVPCVTCGGTRFKPEVLHWRLRSLSLPDFYALSVARATEVLHALPETGHPGVDVVQRQCLARLRTLIDVGLSYLSLDRPLRTLSGGELQRVGLTSALSADLRGTLFVLDEPTGGLHPADVGRLFPVVRRLADGDNVVAVVESDRQFIAGADRIVELGPGAGEHGGQVVFDGDASALRRADTLAGKALRKSSRRSARRAPRACSAWLTLVGASGHNLRDAELRLPLGLLTCVTGVSGSGKSSLLLQTLVPGIAAERGDASAHPLPFRKLTGADRVGEVHVVDQTALSRSSRANPATYLGVWDALRKRLAKQPLSKERGYGPGVFSFNVAGGRCEACKGEGAETVEMQFMADVTFSCPECAGRRFTGPVLDVKLDGLDVADLLELTVNAAVARFAQHADVCGPLQRLIDIGAGYLRLGQPLSTLSGGEAQRLKLAAALSDVRKGDLFVLDEPTAGLHVGDVEPLISSLQALVDAGATAVVIEHDMGVAAAADHVIDMGPGSGDAGGRVVAAGTPAEVAVSGDDSPTAAFLAAAIEGRTPRVTTRRRRGPGADTHVIAVRGAREHNLRGVDVDIPRGKLSVVTGPSGSGKSTLAFDVIFAEAQRRYTETLSPYVRQYLKLLPRPAVEHVLGMPPGVSLEQRAAGGSTHSTVATVTEVAHYLRLAFARAGSLQCPDCEVPIAPRPADAIADDLRTRFADETVRLLAPVIRGRKGAHRDRLARARRDGFTHARIDGELTLLTAGLSLDRYQEHDVAVLVAELPASDAGFGEQVRAALRLGDGAVHVECGDQRELYSERRACPGCGRGFPELDPRFFSFNTTQGACERCEGRGEVLRGGRGKRAEESIACPDCEGHRLGGLALHSRLGGHLITELMSQDVIAAQACLQAIELSGRTRRIAGPVLAEAEKRLRFLSGVGLGYLGLGRAAGSLSGGELQRVRLAAQLGSGLTGLLYVLDEPTIGLHPRDTGRLLHALRSLVDSGCTVLVVEHDSDSIRAADHMVDVGPGAGRHGGRVVAQGAPAALLDNPDSVSGAALARPLRMPARRPVADVPFVEAHGARAHNLKGASLRVPVGRLTAVTGVSGSGKSTLVRDVFLRALRHAKGLVADTPGAHGGVRGAEHIKRAVEVDQSPIGRTPRSVPATYIGIWDEIRKLYARSPEARARGYGASRFSFNVKAGRCPSCDGQGATTVEMAFLPQALVPCEVCGGGRFNEETLAVRLHGLSVGQLLSMEVDEVCSVFSSVPKVKRPLELLSQLGMGYLRLGQASNTLSGGEAQRLKLVSELATAGGGPSLYVMDEPTTGLHRDDVARLLQLIDQLVERGDTVVVIEHHTDLIAHADWVVDLGPEGGEGGGRVVVEGTPEAVMACAESHTGAALRSEAGRG